MKTYVNVHKHFICNSHKLETIQIPINIINLQISKFWYIHAMGYYSATKTNEFNTHNNMDESHSTLLSKRN